MEYVPDPMEIMDSNIERNIDNYIEGHCMGCGVNVGEDNLVLATPSPDAPAICFDCAGIKDGQKLAADFMGYTIIDRLHVKDKNGHYVADGRPWDPWKKREWWDDIWGKMTSYYLSGYYAELHNMWEKFPMQERPGFAAFTHTAKPEICWKAFIKAIRKNKS